MSEATLTRREVELCLLALGVWRSDYEGTDHYDDRAEEAEELASRLSNVLDGKRRQWETSAIKQRLAELEAGQ